MGRSMEGLGLSSDETRTLERELEVESNEVQTLRGQR